MLVNERHAQDFYNFACHHKDKAVVWIRNSHNKEWDIVSSLAVYPCSACILNDIQDEYPHSDRMKILNLNYTYQQMIELLEQEGV